MKFLMILLLIILYNINTKDIFLFFLLSTLGIIQWMYRVTHKWMRFQRRLYGFHVDSLNPRQDYIKDITVILPGYICCIKRVGLTLHWVAQTGKYDWMHSVQYMLYSFESYCVYSTCCTVSNHIVCTVHAVQSRIILCVQYMLYSLESCCVCSTCCTVSNHIVCTVHVVQSWIILCVQYMLYSLESYCVYSTCCTVSNHIVWTVHVVQCRIIQLSEWCWDQRPS